MKSRIFNIQRFCLHDGPGIRTTLFFKGCPLRCIWCHNPESQHMTAQLMYYEAKCSGCGSCLCLCSARMRDLERPQYIRVDPGQCQHCGKCVQACLRDANELCGEDWDTRALFEEVLKDRVFYREEGGMTLSGGEPAMQPEAALELLRLARSSGIGSVVETCGYGNEAFYREAASLGATFYYDLKAIRPEVHHQLTGVSNERILQNFGLLASLGAHIVARIPLVPGCNDAYEDLIALAGFLKARAGQYDHAEIMKYHNLGLGKARALAQDYHAPQESATQADARRWLQTLEFAGVKDIVFS